MPFATTGTLLKVGYTAESEYDTAAPKAFLYSLKGSRYLSSTSANFLEPCCAQGDGAGLMTFHSAL